MNEDIFASIADLEKRADDIVAHAREQAGKLREEIELKLKSLAEELERDYGKSREEIERELAARRKEIFQSFEQRMRDGLAKLDAARREKIEPMVQHVIKAFLEHTHGD